jgi:hypothetical protein
LARDRHEPHQGMGSIRTAQSSRTTVLSPSAGCSILEAMPPLFGQWSLIHAFQPTMRSLGEQSSLIPEQMVNEGLESSPNERHFLGSNTILLQSKNITSIHIQYAEYAEYAE